MPETTFKLVWDKPEEKLYHTGVDRGVLYPISESGTYPKGVVWNGLTAMNENPSGADATDMWADNIKYLSIRAAEQFGYTIEAYMYPDEFAECDGSAAPTKGVTIGQQNRKAFGICYRSTLGNSVKQNDYGYLLHLIYNSTASPSGRNFQTINDSPEAITFSWECNTTPVPVTGFKPTAEVVVNSTLVDPEKLTALETILYGTGDTDARLPLPDEVISILKTTA